MHERTIAVGTLKKAKYANAWTAFELISEADKQNTVKKH